MPPYRFTSLLFVALFLIGCAGMPISSMLKLRKLDPLEADPAQIKVAILADQRIGIPDGGAHLDLKVDAEDGSLNIDESYEIEIVRDRVFATELTAEKTAGESITVLQLSDDDTRQLDQALSRVRALRDAGKKGSASLGVGLDGLCLYRPIPPDRATVDIYLRTKDDDEFIPITRNLNVREGLENTEYSLDQWPECAATSD